MIIYRGCTKLLQNRILFRRCDDSVPVGHGTYYGKSLGHSCDSPPLSDPERPCRKIEILEHYKEMADIKPEEACTVIAIEIKARFKKAWLSRNTKSISEASTPQWFRLRASAWHFSLGPSTTALVSATTLDPHAVRYARSRGIE